MNTNSNLWDVNAHKPVANAHQRIPPGIHRLLIGWTNAVAVGSKSHFLADGEQDGLQFWDALTSLLRSFARFLFLGLPQIFCSRPSLARQLYDRSPRPHFSRNYSKTRPRDSVAENALDKWHNNRALVVWETKTKNQ
jgi:hypothetical protein